MDSGSPASPKHRRRTSPYLVGAALLVALAALIFGRRIQQELTLQFLVRADFPNADALQATVEQAANQAEVLQRLWDTKKMPHRLQVIRYLQAAAGHQPELGTRMTALLLAASRDPDAEVRESALGTLLALKHPELFACAKAQLQDPDPEIRLLGLQHLRQTAAAGAVAEFIRLLDDQDLRVATTSAAILRSWTSNDFGVRIHQAIPQQNSTQAPALPQENLDQVAQGLQRWRTWWQSNQQRYPNQAVSPSLTSPASEIPAGDFTLPNLDRQPVTLSSCQGRVVLLHFWSAWSKPCLASLPTLVALQKLYPDQFVILGVCVDGSRRASTHVPGQGQPPADRADAGVIQQRLQSLVADNDINYPILLDPAGELADRFNAGQLPANILINPHGYVSRRFLGDRSLATWQALIEPLFQSH